MQNEQEQSSAETQELLQKVLQHVAIGAVSVSWPKLTHQITNANVSINGEDAISEDLKKETYIPPRWQLMPKEWAHKFSSFESRARRALDSRSIPYPIAKGMKIIPIMRYREIQENIDAIREEFFETRQAFIEDYTNIIEKHRTELGARAWEAASKKIPTVAQLPSKFSIDLNILPVVPNSVNPEKLSEALERIESFSELTPNETLQHAYDLLAGEATSATNAESNLSNRVMRDFMQRAESQTQKILDSVVDVMAKEPREELANAVDHLVESLRDGRRISTGAISPINRAIANIRGFAFLADKQLLDQMTALENRLADVTPKQLNSDARVGASLAEGLRKMAEKARDEVAIGKAVRRFRGVDRFTPSSRPTPAEAVAV